MTDYPMLLVLAWGLSALGQSVTESSRPAPNPDSTGRVGYHTPLAREPDDLRQELDADAAALSRVFWSYPVANTSAFIVIPALRTAEARARSDMIEWATTATAAGLSHLQCLNPELAKKFNIDFWYNTDDGGGQRYSLPGNHGLLPTTSGY